MKQKMMIIIVCGAFILGACSTGVTKEDEESNNKLIINQEQIVNDELEESDYFCKNTPLAPNCYIPSDDLHFISPTPSEYTIDETLEYEMLNQMPSNWLLYSNPEYKANGVFARVVELDGHRAIHMYSDGLQKPPYPQAAATPTFILSTKFNLDIDRKGIAYGSLRIPSAEGNSVTMGVSAGAVNTISITIDREMKLSVRVGGPFFYFSGNNDAGDMIPTAYTLNHNIWYDFKFTWDAETNMVKAFIIIDEIEILLHEGPFHISNRYNAEINGNILVPNIFKVTMPSGRNLSGFGYLSNVKVERMV